MNYLLAALSALTIVSVIAIYRWVTKPLNRIKRFGDIGVFVGKVQIDKPYRRAYLDHLKKTRSIGNIPPVYPNGWFCVAESRQLKPKEVMPVIFLGQQLTLLRSETGKVHLIDSYCPHLGASFSVGGRVVDDNCIQCPFHGWIFSGETGACTRIPYDLEHSIPEQAKVPVWPVVEKNMHIYVWYHCDGKDPEWQIPDIDEIANGEWQYRGRTEHEISCHIQDLPENGADIAHLNYLHLAGVNKGNDITKIQMENPDPTVRHVWDGRWEQLPEPRAHIGVMYLKQVMTIMKIPIPFTYSNLEARQIGPGIVHMMFDFGWLGRGIVMQHVTPEEPLFQRARFVMYASIPKLYANFFLLCEANHFERDIYVWNHKRYVKTPLLAKNDGPIGKHRRWFSQFYTDNSPRLNEDVHECKNRPIIQRRHVPYGQRRKRLYTGLQNGHGHQQLDPPIIHPLARQSLVGLPELRRKNRRQSSHSCL